MKNFYDAVFFDMDGLFVDSEPLWLLAETELMESFGYTWTTEDQSICLGGPLTRVGQYMFEKSQHANSPEYFTQSVIELMRIKLSSGAPLMPGAIELLEQLTQNKIRAALVSASPRVLVDAVLKSIPSHSFSFSLSADDVTQPKPNPEAYLKASNLCNAQISDCLIFEDSPTGVLAATSSGAHTVAVPHLVKIEPKNRLRVINSLAEVNYEVLVSNYEQDRLI
jgi:HAD superfamily hydrolase (TIGR01509 family)